MVDPIDFRSSLIYFAGTAPCQCGVIVISDIRSEHSDVSEWGWADKLYHFLDHFIDYYFTSGGGQGWLIDILGGEEGTTSKTSKSF